MNFSELEKDDWLGLRPYLDTCLIPFTGLNGHEEPWEVTQQLEQLQELIDLVERPFKGRIVQYPAVQYAPGDAEATVKLLSRIIDRVKATNFRYVVLLSIEPLDDQAVPTRVDLVVNRESKKENVEDKILELWGN